MYTPPFLGLVLYMYPQSRHSHKEFTYTSLPQEDTTTPPPSSSPPSKKSKIHRYEEELETDDPGCIFIFNSDADVHRVLGLPVVATLSPPLQQGKNKKVTSLLL